MPARAFPHADMAGIINSTVRKEWHRYWSSLEHQGNNLIDIKSATEVWKFAFNKKTGE